MKSIHIVYTGGTIGGVLSGKKNVVCHYHTKRDFEDELKRKLPNWTSVYSWEITSPFRKLSEEFQPNDWVILASHIRECIQKGTDGIVIAHGTDTMVFSAAAISIMLQHPPVPIVFTGSNLPLEAKQSDAPQNISHAINVAAEINCPGVFASFAGTPQGKSIVSYSYCLKKDASRKLCIRPAWGDPLAVVIPNRFSGKPRIHLLKPLCKQEESVSFNPQIAVDYHVRYIEHHPGFDPEQLKEAVRKGFCCFRRGR